MLINHQPDQQPTIAPPVYDFAVSDLSPKRQTIWRFKSSARVKLHLTNKSSDVATFQLTGQSDSCSVEFDWPIGAAYPAAQPELQLAAGQSVWIAVRVVLPSPELMGLRRQQFFFTVTSAMLAGGQPRRPLLGQVSRPPIIGPGLMLLLVVGAMVGLFMAWPAPLQPQADSNPAAINPMTAATPISSFVMPVYQAGNTPQDPIAAETGAAITYEQLFQDVAAQYQLDWRMLAEIAYQESRFNPWAIGRSNEMGLMQIHPVTWQAWAPRVGVFDPYDPASNVQVAAAFLAYLRNFCQTRGYSDPHWMLIGYNWGPNNLDKLFKQQVGLDAVPEKPRQYAARILQLGPDAAIRRQAQLEAVVSPYNSVSYVSK
ncbi:MAG: Membrane-bound lytic murein transglycosylase F [Anaerolineae bacterium]|nr:Membrane-bound lytic murein transglycosylase F [Anaerolineae bacterium]